MTSLVAGAVLIIFAAGDFLLVPRITAARVPLINVADATKRAFEAQPIDPYTDDEL